MLIRATQPVTQTSYPAFTVGGKGCIRAVHCGFSVGGAPGANEGLEGHGGWRFVGLEFGSQRLFAALGWRAQATNSYTSMYWFTNAALDARAVMAS